MILLFYCSVILLFHFLGILFFPSFGDSRYFIALGILLFHRGILLFHCYGNPEINFIFLGILLLIVLGIILFHSSKTLLFYSTALGILLIECPGVLLFHCSWNLLFHPMIIETVLFHTTGNIDSTGTIKTLQ